MIITSIINLKGGVGKTISSISIAYNLAALHGRRVLLVDNDKQGNTTKFFDLHDESMPSVSELLTQKDIDMRDIIRPTQYDRLDVIPANMNLVTANMLVLLDEDDKNPQQTRFRKALRSINAQYDYCIIDNAPDINMSTINALVASDYVLIPVKMDKFAFDGLDILLERIEEAKEYNSWLEFLGCFVTAYYKSAENESREFAFRAHEEYKLFDTHIRRTPKVDESTYTGKPLTLFSRYCGASRDYVALTEEMLDKSLPF